MEFSEIFGFLRILKESIKLVSKNGKFMASITLLFALLPSILFLFFINLYQSLRNHTTNSIMNSSNSADSGGFNHQLILLFGVEIVVLIVYVVITHVSGIATILVSAMSYTDRKLSLQDLFSRIKTTWRSQLSNIFRRPKNPIRYALVGLLVAYFLATLYSMPIAIVVAIVLGISVCVFQLYASVVWAVSHVVSIVEGVYEGTEALEKAEELVKGQRHHGFMMNLFFNFVFLIIFLGCWMMLGDKGSLNLTLYGLFFLNSFSLGKIFGCIAYTVLYFQCKKFHGQDVNVFGTFDYIKLPTANSGSDVV